MPIDPAEHGAVAQAIANAHAKSDTADPSGWMERAMEVIVGFDAIQAFRAAAAEAPASAPAHDEGDHDKPHKARRGRKAHAAAEHGHEPDAGAGDGDPSP